MKLITEVNEELEVFEIDEGSTVKKVFILKGFFFNQKL